MSARLVIPARMEPGVLTPLVVTAASVLQTLRENIVTKVTDEAVHLDGVVRPSEKQSYLHDLETNLHLLWAYVNNEKISARFAKLFENRNLLLSPTRRY